MTSYATVAEFAEFGLPTTATAGVVSDAKIEAHLESHSDFADGCFASRGDISIAAPYPQAVVRAVCEMAAFTVLKIRGYNPEGKADKAVKLAHDDAKAWLVEIREGRLTPTFVPVEPAAVCESLPLRNWFGDDGKVW